MSFIRMIDDAALAPLMVYGPYVQESESRNVVVTLMESSSTSVAYVPPVPRSGEFQILFDNYAEAAAARDYFAVGSLFDFLGPTATPGEYIVDAGRIVLVVDALPDPYLSLRFAVRDGAMRVEQDEVDKWTLYVPYQEVP